MHQTISKTLVLPIPGVPGHPADPVAAFQLLTPFPTTSSNQPLLTYIHNTHLVTVTVSMLARALSVLLDALVLDSPFPIQSCAKEGPLPPTDRGWTPCTSNARAFGRVMLSVHMLPRPRLPPPQWHWVWQPQSSTLLPSSLLLSYPLPLISCPDGSIYFSPLAALLLPHPHY